MHVQVAFYQQQLAEHHQIKMVSVTQVNDVTCYPTRRSIW